MLKRIALMVVSSFILFSPSGFCTIENDLTSLDLQRNELLKRVTAQLVSGKITIEDAQKLKNDLDNVVKLETKAKEDPLSTPERVQEISSTIQQINSRLEAATRPTKIWLGIDVRDTVLERKISDTLAQKKITKTQAEGFKRRLDELKARESNGDPTRGFEFDDAMALAVDIQTLNSNIDDAIAGK